MNHRRTVMIACIAAFAMQTSVRAAPPPGEWQLIIDADFKKAQTIDPAMWGSGTSPAGKETVPSKSALIRMENTRVGPDGMIQHTEPGKFTGPSGTVYDYATGWSWLCRGYWMTYGYLEIKAKYPKSVPGAWPAFWMVQDGWPPEIDIAEFRGGPRNYMVNAFAWKTEGKEGATWDGSHPLVENETLDRFTDWHTYGLEWSPDALTWYFDGVVTKKHSSKKIPATALYVILSGGVSRKDADGSGFPNDYVVEYFRWYQHPPREKPSAPSALRATVADRKVMLTWGAPPHAAAYQVRRSENESGPFQLLSEMKGVIPATYIDTAVSNEKSYYYRVAALNEFGEGPPCSPVRAVPSAAPTTVPSTMPK